MNDFSNRSAFQAKCSVICFGTAATIIILLLTFTNPLGFSYVRLWFLCLCWLFTIVGVALGVLAVRKAKSSAVRLLSVAMITLNGAGILFGGFGLAGGVILLKAKHEAAQEDAAAETNTIHLAFKEFRSNSLYYTAQYTNASTAMASFNDIPLSALKSRELLASRGKYLEEFIRKGEQLRKFMTNGPVVFESEIERSGASRKVITNVLRNFKREDLRFWDESYNVIEKTLATSSNTLFLNNFLETGFGTWDVSNKVIVFQDPDLQKEYASAALNTKQSKAELLRATAHLLELQNKRRTKQTNNPGNHRGSEKQ